MEVKPEHKYTVPNPNKLSSWELIARKEIVRFLTDEDYQEEIFLTTMVNCDIGPFTKFLYYFAWKCECGWGVMIDFNEYKQRVFLPDRYYKWMHKLKEEIESGLEQITKTK